MDREIRQQHLGGTPVGKILVLAPHMDDETIGCGGTLALHAQRGAQITVVFLTDGRNGSSEVNTLYGEERERRQRELIELRTTEARAALQRLGVNRMICLDAEDGALDKCAWVAEKLRDVLVKQRPDIVYLPFYLEEHPDHRAASRVLLDAVDRHSRSSSNAWATKYGRRCFQTAWCVSTAPSRPRNRRCRNIAASSNNATTCTPVSA